MLSTDFEKNQYNCLCENVDNIDISQCKAKDNFKRVKVVQNESLQSSNSIDSEYKLNYIINGSKTSKIIKHKRQETKEFIQTQGNSLEDISEKINNSEFKVFYKNKNPSQENVEILSRIINKDKTIDRSLISARLHPSYRTTYNPTQPSICNSPDALQSNFNLYRTPTSYLNLSEEINSHIEFEKEILLPLSTIINNSSISQLSRYTPGGDLPYHSSYRFNRNFIKMSQNEAFKCEETLPNGNINNIENGVISEDIDTNSINIKLQTPDPEPGTNYTKFWILGLFSFIAFFQCILWGTWGPIIDSATSVFPSWTDGSIALLSSWGPITVIIFIIPLSWINQKYGLRIGVLMTTFLMLIGSGIRCINSSEYVFTILVNVGAIINGIAGCLTLSLPAMVAATWFPPHQRTTATAIGSLMCQLGGVAMYLEPLIVRTENENSSIEQVRQDIMNLMYLDTGIAGILFLCVLVYFPNKPKIPPSRSSASERLNYFTSVKAMAKNSQFLLVLLTYVFSFGVPVVWIAVMNISLKCMGIKQEESMWIAIIAVSASGLAAFIVARITDYIYGYLRVTIMVLLALASFCFLWFLLLSYQIITPTTAQVYISVAGGISFEYATVPLLIELAVEIAYPCPESVVGAALTHMFNVISGIFLLLFLIPTECYRWVNIVLVVCTSLTILPLFFVKETHKRSDNDRT